MKKLLAFIIFSLPILTACDTKDEGPRREQVIPSRGAQVVTPGYHQHKHESRHETHRHQETRGSQEIIVKPVEPKVHVHETPNTHTHGHSNKHVHKPVSPTVDEEDNTHQHQ